VVDLWVLEGMFEDPVRTCGGICEAFACTVASGFDSGKVDVNFGHNAGHVDTLVI
jgi:hypothetical protein